VGDVQIGTTCRLHVVSVRSYMPFVSKLLITRAPH